MFEVKPNNVQIGYRICLDNITDRKYVYRPKNRKCKDHGCNIVPHFNYKGKTKGLYCHNHKLDGMINVKDYKLDHKFKKIVHI